MSKILSLLSLRFRGGAGQERGIGACGKLNLNPILLVDGCCNGSCGAEPQQRLWMQFDLAAGFNSVVFRCRDRPQRSKRVVFFMMVEAPF
jgi:hypothetical protein